METRKLAAGFVSIALLAGAGAWAFALPAGQPPAAEKAGEEADEEVIDLAKAPAAVRAAALKVAGTGGEKAIRKVIKEEDEGVTTFEIEYSEGGVEWSAALSVNGDVLELEKSVKESAIPGAALDALKKDYPKATIKSVHSVQKFFYEVEVVIDGKSHEVKVDATGDIEDKSKDGHEDHEHDNDEDPKKGEKNEKEEDDD